MAVENGEWIMRGPDRDDPACIRSWEALAGVSSGVKTIVLTVVISLAAALLFPVKEEGGDGA